jgi:hypothetical protein
MSFNEYVKLLNRRPRWELLNMKKALSMMQILNTEDENNRLAAVKLLLRTKK